MQRTDALPEEGAVDIGSLQNRTLLRISITDRRYKAGRILPVFIHVFMKRYPAALTQKKEYDRLSVDRSVYHGSNYHR